MLPRLSIPAAILALSAVPAWAQAQSSAQSAPDGSGDAHSASIDPAHPSSALGSAAGNGDAAYALATGSRARASQALAEDFAASFGTPTSKAFAALSAPVREAVERYFVYGRGAVPREGIADSASRSSSSAVGIGGIGGIGATGGIAAIGGAGGIVGLGGAQPHLPVFLFGDPVAGYPGLFNVALGDTGTGHTELFLLQLPDVAPSGPTPLLVVFHKFGVSHGDALFNTDFVQEVRTRGWYMLAPLGAVPNNYGYLDSQINVRAAIDWIRTYLPISPTRIYGVGFSMGGGGCASYAARHLDPAGAMFAAIVDHTGSVSLVHVYANDTGAQAILPGLFGGPPATQLFAYQRCSTVDIDPITETIGVDTDMARNLSYVHTWLADQDPNPYLPTETQLFGAHVQALNPADVMTIVPGTAHSWTTLDDTAACDWLAQHTLEEPLIGNTLADQDGAWHRFIVEQDASGAFTPFSWFSTPAANRLNLWATANLHRISVDPGPLGLVYSGVLKLNLSSADGTGDQVLFLHVPHPPIAVTRNGVPDASGVYSHQAQTFLIDEMSGSGAQWMLTF